ncbi:MAG TPA: hypothetical protein VFT99_03860, partial [Roseiflexaceae bacterium]|nr:hypothetical protein [Roseiflexaceae bacterium]
DFSVGGLLRILYRYGDSPLLPGELRSVIEDRILHFKYWWDEAGGDNRRCYWTENHQIIFHADELLAAQLFPQATFANSGRDAAYHAEHALHLIRRWFDFRARFGFSEWLSNNYFEEDLLALVNLYDFARQPDIRRQAKACIDVLMFEMALHTFRGIMGCTHGRTYPRLIKGARHEDATNTARLMFGMGLYCQPANLGTIPLATSSYRCPPIFERIAADLQVAHTFKERHSIEIADAPRYGLSFDNLEDGHLYWSVQDYIHESIYDLAQQTRQAFGIMLYEDYLERYFQVWNWQVEQYGRIVDRNIDCHGMTEVHIQTYRSAHVMLSSAQSFRPGKPGYQQHPWQATLGPDAVVFTNHPGSDDETARPNFWAGNGILPRVAQHNTALICLHHVPADDRFPFSHAYFPRNAFDEVIERSGWVFGRRGQGYIGLYSHCPLRWLPDRFDGAHAMIELRADTPANAWIVEVGDSEGWRTFAEFVDAVAGAEVTIDGLEVTYVSPSVGMMQFGWHGPLRIAGAEVELHNYARFENAYCQAEWGARQYTIRYGDEQYQIDFEEPRLSS